MGLDLSASNLGDSDYRLPALLLCDLERGSSGVWVVEAGPDFLCLGADNKLYQARLPLLPRRVQAALLRRLLYGCRACGPAGPAGAVRLV